MATIQPKIYDLGAGVGVRMRWEGMSTGDQGAHVSRPEYPNKAVQITGELLDGGLEGTHTPDDPASWMPVPEDETSEPLTRPGLYTVRRNPLFLRPSVRRGDNVAWDIVFTVN